MEKSSIKYLLRDGFIRGIGWAFGVTIGFVVISSLLVVVFNSLGGTPLMGSWIASIVEATQKQLMKRSPLY
jgi:hypothetical protein